MTSTLVVAPTKDAGDVTAARRNRLPRWTLLWAPSVIPSLLMLAIGRYRVGHSTFGWDELATLSAARRTPGEIIALAQNVDGVIAPYYLFMHFWTGLFGSSEIAFRMPSVIAVAMGVGLAGELGRRLLGPGVGLITGLILCAVPSLSVYAQEARAYGIAFFLATLATLLCYRAVERPTWWRWSAYGLAVALAGLAHLFTLAVLVPHAVIVIHRLRQGESGVLRRWLAATGIGVLPCLPLAWLGAHQQDQQLGWIAPITVNTFLNAPGGVFGTRGSIASANPRTIAIAFLVIGLALTIRGAARRTVTELVVWAVGPATLFMVASFVEQIWVPRYALSSLVPLAILAAASVVGPRQPGITSLKWPVVVRSILVLGLLGGLALSVVPILRGPGAHQGGNYRTLAQVFADRDLADDVVVYAADSDWGLRSAMGYYVPADVRPADLLLKESAASRGQLSASEYAIEEKIGQPKYVWYVRYLALSTDPFRSEPRIDALKRDHRAVQTWHSGWIYVILWERIE